MSEQKSLASSDKTRSPSRKQGFSHCKWSLWGGDSEWCNSNPLSINLFYTLANAELHKKEELPSSTSGSKMLFFFKPCSDMIITFSSSLPHTVYICSSIYAVSVIEGFHFSSLPIAALSGLNFCVYWIYLEHIKMKFACSCAYTSGSSVATLQDTVIDTILFRSSYSCSKQTLVSLDF